MQDEDLNAQLERTAERLQAQRKNFEKRFERSGPRSPRAMTSRRASSRW